MAVAMILPLVAIVLHLVVKAWPTLSWEFLVDVPREGMREGGIWPALVGTIYLVFLSLAAAAPVGILAAIYLNEYARDNWFNRIINLAVINLAGVPSIVHALFGLGAFVYAARFGYSIISASLTLAIMTLPVIIASTREALAAVPAIVPGSLLERRRDPLADNPVHCPAELDQRDPDRRDPAGQPGGGRDGADHVYGRGVLQGGRARESAAVLSGRAMHGAVDASLHDLDPGARREGIVAVRHRGRAAGRRAARQRRRHRAARRAALAQEMVIGPCLTHPAIEVSDLRLSYGTREVIHGVSFAVERHEILAVIGPAQSGKTSLLRCINRTIEFVSGTTVTGQIRVFGQEVGRVKNVYELRRRIGMVAPLPVGLPLTVYDNVAFAPRCAGLTAKGALDDLVEKCLRQAALWDEVKDRLNSLGTRLSGGQQQRLTIARALSHQPEILCLDEFSIAIDPVTTMRIEEVLRELRREMTIVLVTNLTQQARRLADRTLFLFNGEKVELDRNEVVFSDQPGDRRTYEYINGIFG